MLVLALGPTYFYFYEARQFFKNLPGKTIFDKLFSKGTGRTDVYLHTLQLVHTVYEDIPFFFVYIFSL